MSHVEAYFDEVEDIATDLDKRAIETMAANLSLIEGRIYLIGLGGSLPNCEHFANDLRKLCLLDAAHPGNAAEMTAWANDSAWAALFDGYLQSLSDRDALFVLSVGGGADGVSTPICRALGHAQRVGAKIFGIVGPKGGMTAQCGHHVIRIPVQHPGRITPHTEAFQAVIWHCLVSHPLLQKNKTKW